MLTPPSPSRRWFLRGLVATAVAPAIVRADSLMRIVPRTALVVVREPVLDAVGAYTGVVRVVRLFDILTDTVVERFDVWDGRSQVFVDVRHGAPSSRRGNERELALQMLAREVSSRAMGPLAPLPPALGPWCNAGYVDLPAPQSATAQPMNRYARR